MISPEERTVGCVGAFFAAWRAVRAGAVGQVRLIHAQKSYRLGTRPPYYRSRATYGGTIPWVGSHAIDLIHWFAAADFVSVCAAHSTVGNHDHGDLEASAACQFVLTDGVLGTASIDYLRPSSAPSHGDDRVRVAGTDGVIEVRDETVLLIAAAAGPQLLEAACPHRMLVDFVHQVEGHSQALIGLDATLAVTRACLLARDAADRSQLLRF